MKDEVITMAKAQMTVEVDERSRLNQIRGRVDAAARLTADARCRTMAAEDVEWLLERAERAEQAEAEVERLRREHNNYGPDDDVVECPDCEGSGEVQVYIRGSWDQRGCQLCNAQGEVLRARLGGE